MGEPMPNDGSEVIRVVVDAQLREEFENWRRRQHRIPSLSEGVRRLMSASLAAAEQSAA